MTADEIKELIDQVVQGRVSPDEAVRSLQSGPMRSSMVAFAEVDHHRPLRHGIGEVIYGESKTIEQIISIAQELAKDAQPVLITRLNAEKLTALSARFTDGRINETGRTFTINAPAIKGPESGEPWVAVIAAGTSDAPVSEEAAEVCVAGDVAFKTFYDVGVAGIHRILGKHDIIAQASAIVVVAGMEGALPSVVGGLFGKPIFAVPTSVGYGASFGGVAALLGMLNSCAPGVAVFNIDNGFDAGFAACQVVREIKRVSNG